MCDGCKGCKNSSSCCDVNLEVDQKVLDIENKILLMGNPNVGKSVFFSSLTGTYVTSSNYAGTTVTYTKAKMMLDEEYQLIDVPGTYSLSATSDAEEVAVSFMQSKPKAVICVLDATNLKRNLNLALEIQKQGVPVVFALNLVDIAKRKGIEIDSEKLAKELNAVVINTVAVKKEGFDELKEALTKVVKEDVLVRNDTLVSNEDLWKKSEEITNLVTTKSDKELSFIDRLGDNLVKPFPGILIALLVVVVSLCIIVFGGKAVRGMITYPLITAITTFLSSTIGALSLPEMLKDILVGEYGILIIGLQWPIDLILPFVFMFYLVFTFLEDCGFLPRMAVLFDNIMRKMGVKGGSLISLLMGYGCAVPAIIGTRNSTTKKERIIVTTMVCFAVPCISQLGALIAFLSEKSILLIFPLFLFSFLIIFLVGLITSKILKGKIDPIIIEIPNLLVPEVKSYFKKVFVRLKNFLLEAEIPMLIAVFFIALLTGSGLYDYITDLLAPIMVNLLGLPKDAASLLLLGVIRREISLLPLLDFDLNTLQVIVAAVVSLFYLPCISVFGVISKEFNSRTAVAIFFSTFVTAILFGTIINYIGQFIMMIF